MFLGEEDSITYRLDEGQALQAAKDIHEYSKIVNEEFKKLSEDISKMSYELEQKIMEIRNEFELKHALVFTEMFDNLGQALNLSTEEIKLFHLDCSYLEAHNIAFMKQSQSPNILKIPEIPNNGL